MVRVWFGLADRQTRLAGLGLEDNAEEDEEVSNGYFISESKEMYEEYL